MSDDSRKYWVLAIMVVMAIGIMYALMYLAQQMTVAAKKPHRAARPPGFQFVTPVVTNVAPAASTNRLAPPGFGFGPPVKR